MRISLTSLLLLAAVSALSQAPQDSTYKRHYVGSSLFVFGNFATTNKPDFAQLSLGYRITPWQVVSVEFKTWKYAWPLGIPYGENFEAPVEKYPGYIRDFGIALAYQHFFWKGVYGAIHVMNTLQKYYDVNGHPIQNGYQLFLTYRIGYHFTFFKNRLFIEPSIAMTHWPIKTNTPADFKALEDKWPNYFLFEPGLHFGYKF